MQNRNSNQQRGIRRPRLHLHRRSRQYRNAYSGVDRRCEEGCEFTLTKVAWSLIWSSGRFVPLTLTPFIGVETQERAIPKALKPPPAVWRYCLGEKYFLMATRGLRASEEFLPNSARLP